MWKKTGPLAICTCLFVGMFAAHASAVQLNSTPYLPSLQSPSPTIPGGDARTYGPKAGSSKCYGSVGCSDSGNYISKEGVLRYKSGEPLQVRPSKRSPATRFGPSSNHIRWCSERYRSYRSTDNTYQPYVGPRTSCNSPFQ